MASSATERVRSTPATGALGPILAALLATGLGCDRSEPDFPAGDDDTTAGDDDTTAGDDDSADDDDDSAADDDDTPPLPAAVADEAWTVHPHVGTLLRVTWTQVEAADAAWVEYIFPSSDWRTTPEQDGAEGEHAEVLLGIPGGSEVSLRIVNRVGDETRVGEALVSATTDPLPAELPLPTAVGWNEALSSDDRWFLVSLEKQQFDWYRGPWWLLVLDRLGRVVWYYRVPDDRCTMHARLALDGTHMLFEETTIYTGDEGAGSLLRRLTLDMARDEEIPIPGLGSTFAETDDGLILFDDYTDFPETWLEELHPDGTRRRIWMCNEWGAQYGLNHWGCDPNETIWVRDTDTVLWSMWSSDTVLELDRETGELLHQWGQVIDSWAFEPEDSAFEMQHYPHYTEDGTLLVSTHIPGELLHRIREYEIDHAEQTLREIWSYGEGIDLYPRYAGEAFRLDNGNVLVNYGTESDIREITYDSQQVVWQITWDADYLIGHISPIRDLDAIGRGSP